MTDVLKTSSDWLEGQRKAFRSQTVTYRRGAATVSLSATIGRTEFDVEGDYGGILEKWESRDFLILAADLILASATVEPEPGDEIDETQGGVVYTYRVMSPPNEPEFKYSDDFRKTLRIHTKLVGQVAA